MNMSKLVHSLREFMIKTGLTAMLLRGLDLLFLLSVLVYFVSQMSDFTHVLLSPFIATANNITALRGAVLAVKTFRR